MVFVLLQAVRVREGEKRAMEMEKTEKEKNPAEAASEQVSREFKTLVCAEDVQSLKQLQLTMYYFFPFSPNACWIIWSHSNIHEV